MQAYREEIRGVDREEGDLIDFWAEQCQLRVLRRRGQTETTITWRELVGLVVEERIPGTESNAKSEAIRSLNLGIGARVVDTIRVLSVETNCQQRQD